MTNKEDPTQILHGLTLVLDSTQVQLSINIHVKVIPREPGAKHFPAQVRTTEEGAEIAQLRWHHRLMEMSLRPTPGSVMDREAQGHAIHGVTKS